MYSAIKLISIIVLVVFFSSGCKQSADNQQHYEILKEILNTHQENNIFLDSMVTQLDFQIPIDVKYLDEIFYGKKFNTDIDSIVTSSDLKYWNEALNRFKPERFVPENYDNIPFYSLKKKKPITLKMSSPISTTF